MRYRYSGKLLHINFGGCFEASMNRKKSPARMLFCLTRKTAIRSWLVLTHTIWTINVRQKVALTQATVVQIFWEAAAH